MFLYTARGLPTTFPDSDMCGHDNIRRNNFCAWFVMNGIMNACLDRIHVVRMVVWRRSSEEVYAGRFTGFCMMACAAVFVCRFIRECRRI